MLSVSIHVYIINKKWYIPYNPPDIKLYVEDMAHMTMFEFAHNLARIKVPYLNAAVVARANKSSSLRVE